MTLINEADAIYLGPERVESIHAGARLIWPSWLPRRGPDGALPVQQANWAAGTGWHDGVAFQSIGDYLAAASGTFTRGSDASWFDAEGNLQIAGPNELRRDHDFGSGAALGFRAEGESMNVFTRSSFDSNWNLFGNTMYADPMDGLPAFRFTERLDEANSFQHQWQQSNRPVTVGLWSKSAWFRPGERTAIRECDLFADGARASDVAIYPFRNGWVRVSRRIAITADGNDNSGFWRCRAGAFATSDSYIGDGASGLWTALPQWEKKGFPTTPILSQGMMTTRLADSLSFDQNVTAAGTVLIHARTAPGAEGDQVLWQWDDGTEQERFRLVRDSEGGMHAVVTVSGSDVVDLDLGAAANDTDLALAFAWGAGRFAASLNGGAAVTVAGYAGALPAARTLREGTDTGGNAWFGTITGTVRYQAAYSDAGIEAMTA